MRECVRACRDAVKAACNYVASHKPTDRGYDFSPNGVPYFRISERSGVCVFYLKCHIEASLIQDPSLQYRLISSTLKALEIMLTENVFLMSCLFEMVLKC